MIIIFIDNAVEINFPEHNKIVNIIELNNQIIYIDHI